MPTKPSVEISRSKLFEGVSSLHLPTRSEHFITIHADDSIPLTETAAAALKSCNATPVSQFIFGSLDPISEQFSAPTMQLCGDGENHRDRLRSLQIVASSETEIEPLMLNGVKIGYLYEDNYARYCRIGALCPEHSDIPRTEQAQEVFQKLEQVLRQSGMQPSDLVRTWLYLDRLLEWYDQFNRVRTEFFEKSGIFERLVPVSTGIGAANTSGSALAAAALAVQPKDGKLSVERIVSPLQCEADDYRSSFSRAMELGYPKHRFLMISGTASIDPQGRTAHSGDAAKQIELSMRVVRAILESRDMDWDDAFRGIAYFKNIEDYPLYESYCRGAGISEFPTAIVEADICRHDLLFEIEIDAVIPAMRGVGQASQ